MGVRIIKARFYAGFRRQISHCVWDTTRIDINGKMIGGTASMKGGYQLVEDKFKDDNGTLGTNGVVNIGDIITFGKY